jgi:hypothetical protein
MGGEMSDKLRAAAKTKMTMAELRNMIRMSNTITFAKHMKRAEPEEIERVFLACINEWLRGDDELTRLKRGKNT